MDFNDTAEEAAWRDEFRAWLEENAPKVVGPRARARHGDRRRRLPRRGPSAGRR